MALSAHRRFIHPLAVGEVPIRHLARREIQELIDRPLPAGSLCNGNGFEQIRLGCRTRNVVLRAFGLGHTLDRVSANPLEEPRETVAAVRPARALEPAEIASAQLGGPTVLRVAQGECVMHLLLLRHGRGHLEDSSTEGVVSREKVRIG